MQCFENFGGGKCPKRLVVAMWGIFTDLTLGVEQKFLAFR